MIEKIEHHGLALVNMRQLTYFGKGQIPGWSLGQGISIMSDVAELCRMLPVGAVRQSKHEWPGKIHRYGEGADIRSHRLRSAQ